MKKNTLLLSVVLNLLILNNSGSALAADVTEQIKRCTKLSDADRRLKCFDTVAELSNLTGHVNYIQPEKRFLESSLVTVAWKPEYTLTIRSFVDLISRAIMDDGGKIIIHGWTREAEFYVLHITMETPIEVKFLPRKSGTNDVPMSLLQELHINGHTINAEIFVFSIASMEPQ